jgi:hypothetical protein
MIQDPIRKPLFNIAPIHVKPLLIPPHNVHHQYTYTPFQLLEDATFDGINLSGWKCAMLLHRANSGHDLHWKEMVNWPIKLTKDLKVPPPPDCEADNYKPTASP